MSESVSTSLTPRSNVLTEGSCSSLLSFLKFISIIVSFILLYSLILSLVSESYNLGVQEGNESKCKRRYQKKCCYRQQLSSQELFSNDELYSYKKAQSAGFQSVALTSLDDSQQNLMFGQANRYIYVSPEKNDVYRLEIFANLHVLYGNVYDGNDNIKQSYKAYLKLKDDILYIGDLEKGGDGIYKLKYISNDAKKLSQYDQLLISYHVNDKQNTILQAEFE